MASNKACRPGPCRLGDIDMAVSHPVGSAAASERKMVVTIDEIRDEGLTLQAPVSPDLLAETLQEGAGPEFKPVSATPLTATFRKVSGGVLLKGDLTIRMASPCTRCLTDIQLNLPVSFSLNFIPKSALELPSEDVKDDELAPEAGTFDLEDANQELFDGKKIDLDPVVREQVLLALPMHAVCRDDCKGLCGMCGQNLNEAQCRCEPKGVDPRLEALKNIKLN